MRDDSTSARAAPASTRRIVPFLTAEWLHLAMLNYHVSPALLEGRAPRGTELDRWNGACHVSLVGFVFRDTRMLGVTIPFHRDFPEVNLRFYVRRTDGAETRRAVTFVRELVPLPAVALVARVTYNEPYVTVAMTDEITPDRVTYRWRNASAWSSLVVDAEGAPLDVEDGSEEQFLTQRHWGYTSQRDGGTIEYEVRHRPWRVRRARNAKVSGDLVPLYGPEFARVLAGPPDSAFLVDGSAVQVLRPKRLRRP
jgi:uncharacterized protein YqjF (DUF2071 family)